MSGKLYNLNTRCFVSVLMQVSKNYAEYHNRIATQGGGEHYSRNHRALLAKPLVALDKDRAIAFTHALVKTVVTSFLAYEVTDTQSDILAKLMFGEDATLEKEIQYFIDDFLTVDEIDNIYIDIDQQIATLLNRASWNVVDIFDMGHSISIVVQEDIRIREWKQMKGMYKGGFSPTVDLDLSSMIAYLRIRANQKLNPITVRHTDQQTGVTTDHKIPVGDRLDFKAMIVEMLTARYGFLHTPNTWTNITEHSGIGNPRNYELLIASGLAHDSTKLPLRPDEDAILTVSAFLDRLVAPVIESFAVHQYMKRLDDTQRYTVEISSDEHLLVTLDEVISVKIDPTQRLKELADSYLRGDYLPRKDREDAERYIHENNLL